MCAGRKRVVMYPVGVVYTHSATDNPVHPLRHPPEWSILILPIRYCCLCCFCFLLLSGCLPLSLTVGLPQPTNSSTTDATAGPQSNDRIFLPTVRMD